SLDVMLANGENVMVSKARFKQVRRTWKELSALYRFVASTVPEVERITVQTAPRNPEGTDHEEQEESSNTP
ncbi:MAG: hypothetical protein AAF438_22920, partial [Pseudomonadota bacterium]